MTKRKGTQKKTKKNKKKTSKQTINKQTNKQIMTYETLHRKLKIEQHESH